MHENSRSGDVFSIVSRTSKRGKSPKKQISELPLAPPCGKCGSEVGKLGAGRKPKESSFYCCPCRTFICWLSASQVSKLPNHHPDRELVTSPEQSGDSQYFSSPSASKILKDPNPNQLAEVDQDSVKPKNKRSPSSGESAFCHSNNGDE